MDAPDGRKAAHIAFRLTRLEADASSLKLVSENFELFVIAPFGAALYIA